MEKKGDGKILTPNFRQKGFRKEPELTKSELRQHYDTRLQMLEQQLLGTVQAVGQAISEFKKTMESLDFRTLGMMEILKQKGLCTEEEFEKIAEGKRTEAYAKEVDETIANMKLVTLPQGSISKLGDFVVVSLKATDKTTNNKVIDMPRLLIELGRGAFSIIEKELVGMAAGDKKAFAMVLPKEFGPIAGKDVAFEVESFAVLSFPVAPVAPAPVTPETQEKKEDGEKTE